MPMNAADEMAAQLETNEHHSASIAPVLVMNLIGLTNMYAPLSKIFNVQVITRGL
jgi:hypothetical protein